MINYLAIPTAILFTEDLPPVDRVLLLVIFDSHLTIMEELNDISRNSFLSRVTGIPESEIEFHLKYLVGMGFLDFDIKKSEWRQYSLNSSMLNERDNIHNEKYKKYWDAFTKRFNETYWKKELASIEKKDNTRVVVTEKNSSNKKRNSYAYIMKDDNLPNLVKIGKSDQPKFREKTLQGEKPTISLFKVLPFETSANAKSFETKLHKKYARFRKRGEWFELPEKELGTLLKSYNWE